MTELIGSAPASQILILMAMPLTIAVLLGAFIAFSLRQRSQKSKMKLGIQPKSSPPSIKLEEPPKASAPAVSPPPAPSPPAPPEKWLNLNILNKPVTVEKEDSSMAETSQPFQSEPINLAARLGRQEITSPPPPPPQTALEPVELLRLLRHPESGHLIVEVAGQHYTKLADITDKKIGQYILKLVAHLLVFTNGVILTSAGMKSVAMPKVEDVPEPLLKAGVAPKAPTPTAPPQVVPPPPSPDAEAALLAALKAAGPTPPLSSPKPGGLFGRAASSAPVGGIPGLNLAQEINDIVQARLRYSPLANQRIEITSALGGGIRIQVNNKFYSSPDDVEEPEAKALIKASIKEWESK